MSDLMRAADLPEGSVVVDDLKGVAWYALGQPGDEDRWEATGGEPSRSDPAIDYALRHGAVVLRVGDGEP